MGFNKQVELTLSSEAEEVYIYLNKQAEKSKIERSILNAVNQKSQLIRQNIYYGNPVSKKLIPPKFIKEYEITNLCRVEPPNYWRMLYSLIDGEDKVESIAFVLELCDHKKYNKLFGYN